MDGILNTVIAYALIMFGPPVGTYLYLKNSNKIISGASKMVSKAASKVGGFAGNTMQKRFKRSTLGVGLADRERALDNQGMTEGRSRLQKLFAEPKPGDKEPNWLQRKRRSAARFTYTRGMSDRTKRNYSAQLAGQDNEIYRGEVEGYKTQFGRDYSSKALAQEHFWERMKSGDVGAAETHALHDHMLGFDGGASWVDKVWTGAELDRDGHNIGYHMKQNQALGGDAYVGAQRSILSESSKFKGGSADATYAMTNFSDGYLNELAASDGQTKVGTGRAVDKFLGQNWTQYEYEIDPVTGNWKRDALGIPVAVKDAAGKPVPKTVTFTDTKGVSHTETLLATDPNGGLDYTGERAKNMMGMGSRLAAVQAASGLMTDEGARAIIDSPTSTEREHVVRESAERRLKDIENNGGAPIKPAKINTPTF